MEKLIKQRKELGLTQGEAAKALGVSLRTYQRYENEENLGEVKLSKILETLKEMDDNELVTFWNEYCSSNSYYDDIIYDYDAMVEMMSDGSNDAMYWVNRFFYGYDEFNGSGNSANPNRNFFIFNGYANIVSFDYIYNEYADEFYNMDADALVDYIVENSDALYNDTIQELLDSIEE